MIDIVRGAIYFFEFHKRSILGYFLFNIFICDMLYFLEHIDIENYVDNSRLCWASKNAEFVVNNLEQPSVILFNGLTITTWM